MGGKADNESNHDYVYRLSNLKANGWVTYLPYIILELSSYNSMVMTFP